MTLHFEKRNLSGQGSSNNLKANQVSTKDNPSKVTGPIFAPVDWKRALDVLDLCLQNFVWRPGENTITVSSVFAAMHQRGPTLLLIKVLLQHLIAEKVFEVKWHTVSAGYHREPGIPLPIFRSSPERTNYLVTTQEKWFTYLAKQRQAEALACPDSALEPVKNETLSERDNQELLVRAQDVKQKPDAPASFVNEDFVATDGPHAFATFSKKQRQLLLTLQSRLPVPMADVQKALYGNTTSNTKTLEQLATRTNQSLTVRNTGLEIKRKTNTFQLVPI